MEKNIESVFKEMKEEKKTKENTYSTRSTIE